MGFLNKEIGLIIPPKNEIANNKAIKIKTLTG